jgi:hypothetical protein
VHLADPSCPRSMGHVVMQRTAQWTGHSMALTALPYNLTV